MARDFFIPMKSAFFYDGFNLYHEINKRKAWHKYKWLDLRKLSERVMRKGHVLGQVLYFSAYCTWDVYKEKRHRAYVQALAKHGVQTILGKFIPVTEEYVRVRNKLLYVSPCEIQLSDIPEVIEYETYLEKRTDVNLAARIVDLAYKNAFDCAYIVTGDGDIASAIEIVKQKFPAKRFIAVLPFKPKERARDIVKECHELIELTEADIAASQLPDVVVIDPANSVTRPNLWK